MTDNNVGSGGPRMERRSVKWSAVALGVMAALLVVLVALFFIYPDLLVSIIWIVLIIIVALVVIGLLIALIAAVIAVPVYAAKGEQVQKGASYSLDDVKPVDGKTADRDEEPKKRFSSSGRERRSEPRSLPPLPQKIL